MKVLHVLDHSLPIQSGYAFRSASILRALHRAGVESAAVTSPKHDSRDADTLNGMTYERAWRKPLGSGVAGQVACVSQTRARLRELIAAHRPDILHAHSPCLNGLAAMGLGIPLVYEIRSSWEDAAVSSGTTAEGSLRYRMSALLETTVARRADNVVVLCNGLRDEFQRRGIVAGKITVIGNAVDRSSFRKPDAAGIAVLRTRYHLEGMQVLGFFGSYFAWEGLDNLVRALPLMRQRNDRIAVLLAGSGNEENALRALAYELGVGEHVHFAGRVDHDEMPDYYGLADIMVFPRRKIRIAEMVTPLKPLEAMHFGCLVLASDVGGHRELIEEGRTGILFEPDDPRALAEAVVAAVGDEERAAGIRRRAENYLEAERSWDRMAERYVEVYERAMARGAGKVAAA
ncbi:MAG: TIGR04063 family PEP-CTERM/XrtA system glycosyltransferase [Woeseia sp.]